MNAYEAAAWIYGSTCFGVVALFYIRYLILRYVVASKKREYEY